MDSDSRGLEICREEFDMTASMNMLLEQRLSVSYTSTRNSFRLWLLLASSALLITQVAGAQGSDEVFVIRLYGTNEIGHPGDPNGSGEARLNFDASSETCSFEIKWVLYSLQNVVLVHLICWMYCMLWRYNLMVHRANFISSFCVKAHVFVSSTYRSQSGRCL